jgi:hypothetical protein
MGFGHPVSSLDPAALRDGRQAGRKSMKCTEVTPAWVRTVCGLRKARHIRIIALTGLMLLAVLVLPGAASAFCPSPPFGAEFYERQLYEQCLREERQKVEDKNKEIQERNKESQEKLKESIEKSREERERREQRERESSAPSSSPPEESTEGGTYPSTTQLFVHVKGCTVTADWRVNHSEYAKAGYIALKIERYDPSRGRWKVTDSETNPEKDIPWYWEQRAGTYRMRARFLGNSHLYASQSAATKFFHLKHGCRHEPPAP